MYLQPACILWLEFNACSCLSHQTPACVQWWLMDYTCNQHTGPACASHWVERHSQGREGLMAVALKLTACIDSVRVKRLHLSSPSCLSLSMPDGGRGPCISFIKMSGMQQKQKIWSRERYSIAQGNSAALALCDSYFLPLPVLRSALCTCWSFVGSSCNNFSGELKKTVRAWMVKEKQGGRGRSSGERTVTSPPRRRPLTTVSNE